MNIFQILYARWKSESPKLFVKIKRIGVTLTAAGVSVLVSPNLPYVTFHVPDAMTKIAIAMTSAGFWIAFISTLTCQDPSKLDQSTTKP